MRGRGAFALRQVLENHVTGTAAMCQLRPIGAPVPHTAPSRDRVKDALLLALLTLARWSVPREEGRRPHSPARVPPRDRGCAGDSRGAVPGLPRRLAASPSRPAAVCHEGSRTASAGWGLTACDPETSLAPPLDPDPVCDGIPGAGRVGKDRPAGISRPEASRWAATCSMHRSQPCRPATGARDSAPTRRPPPAGGRRAPCRARLPWRWPRLARRSCSRG
jgi:hypothetical protein